MGDIIYIFLDVDGVLNKKSQWNTKTISNQLNQSNQTTQNSSQKTILDDECIKNFCEFVNQVKDKYKKDVRIILSSTWRIGFVGSKMEFNSTYIKELENKLGKYNVEISGKTPIFNNKKFKGELKRDAEIDRFLMYERENPHNKGKMIEYIIIDDDRNEFSYVSKYNYFVDANFGFTKKDIKDCIRCLH